MNTETARSEMTRIRVVLVDDSRDVRYLLATILEVDGRFQIVGEARCASDGITMVEELQPDLVLVDLDLADDDGRDGAWVIAALRGMGSDAVLAVVTGSTSEDERAAALAAGADSVHDKVSMTSSMVDALASSVGVRRPPVST